MDFDQGLVLCSSVLKLSMLTLREQSACRMYLRSSHRGLHLGLLLCSQAIGVCLATSCQHVPHVLCSLSRSSTGWCPRQRLVPQVRWLVGRYRPVMCSVAPHIPSPQEGMASRGLMHQWGLCRDPKHLDGLVVQQYGPPAYARRMLISMQYHLTIQTHLELKSDPRNNLS